MKIENCPISLLLPTGFEVMGKEDFEKLGRKLEENEFAIRNQASHCIYEINWSKLPLLLKWAKLDNIVQNNERRILSQNPTFQKVENVESRIGGEKAMGFSYNYIASNIPMAATLLWAKVDSFCYCFNFMSQQASLKENEKNLLELINSIQFEK